MIGDVFIRSGPDYGLWKNGGPYGAAIHCLQCGPNVNVASLAGPGSYTDNEGVSPHTMSDRKQVVQILDETHSGAHIGSAGNPMLVGFEVVGYAEWTRPEWNENAPAVLNQMKAVGKLWVKMGWSVNDLRWGSLAELAEARQRYLQGLPPKAPRMWPHWDVTKSIGGTTHWDVGLGYPFEDAERWAREWVIGAGAGGSGSSPDVTPDSGTGQAGAQSNYVDWLLKR